MDLTSTLEESVAAAPAVPLLVLCILGDWDVTTIVGVASRAFVVVAFAVRASAGLNVFNTSFFCN